MKHVLDTENHLYLFALGKFVNQFCDTESMAFMFLSNLLKMDRNDFSAIASGAKIEVRCSYIKRVYEARQTEMPQNIAECIEHLFTIKQAEK